MPHISLTRLRIRSIRFLPFFAIHTTRSIAQVRKAPGFHGGRLLPDRDWTFWTLTAWDNRDAMLRYITTGDHKAAMPHLMHWCDQASVAHWEQSSSTLPTWEEANRHMRASGRPSKLHHPSPDHATLAYREPRTTGGAPITPAP
jgi:heme-degrading monooxygenase HmoA